MSVTTTTGSLQKNSSRQTKRLNHPVWTCHAEHSMAVCIALVLWIGLIPLSSRAQVPPEDHRALRAPEAIRSVAADTLVAKAVRQHPFTGTSGDQLGSAAAGGDVNGDGFSDVIVGAPLSGAGRVRIYFGGLRPGTTPDVTLTGTSASDRFGWSVAATDLNADGVDDVIVGAPLRDVLAKTNAGVAYVFYGARSWGGVVSATEADVQYTGAAMDDRLGSSVAAAGDANGDGWPDLLVGAPLADAGLEFNDAGRAYLFFGGFGRSGSVSAASADFSVIGEAPFDEFGHAVGSAGDVNGDGYADLLVGAPNNDGGGSNAGRGYVVLGGDALSGITLPAASADLVLTGASGERLGTAVSPAGDVNGDGFSDFVLGAPFASPDGRTEAGRADLYLGRAVLDADPDVVLAGAAAGDHFGTAVAAADDLNGDGYADVAVGANTNDAAGEDAGRAYVFFGDGPERGGPIQGGTRMDAAPDITLTGDASEDLFGTTLAPAGDVDGDGYGDLLVGAPGNDTGGALSGRAYLVSNRMTGTAHPNAVVTGPGPTGRLGESVAAAGDVNGDGYEDVLVGAPFHDEPAPLGENVGRAYLLYGGPQMDADPDVTITGEAGGDQFGEAVAPAGDVNGDGYGDIVVGVKLNDAGSSSGVWAGRTYVFFGGPNLPATLSAFEDAQVILNGEAPTNFFGWSVASAGDVNADGFSDIIVGARDAGDDFTGRAYVFLGGPDLVGTLEAAAADMILIGEATDDAFGFEVAPVGDVDGDGYDDVGVLAPRPNDSEGLAYLFRGRAPLPAVVDAADATFRLRAEPPFTWLASIAGADLNRDGFSDLIVGSRGLSSSTDVGRVGVVFGGTDLVGTISTANVDVVLRGSWGDDANDRFGTALAAGDINADGFSDIVVGAHFFPLTSDPGRAYAFYGGPTLDTAPDVTYYGEQPEDQFGLAVATGDVNGDGRSDVMVGAPWNDSGGADAGRLYLYTAPPPVVVPRITSVGDVPADQGGQVAVAWTRSGYDVRGLARITRYLVQRSQPPGPTGFQWETVATVPASQEPRYSDAVPTYNDQTDSHRGTTYFRIVAETDHPDAYWRSMVARGASVDNLAPETPEDPLLRVDRSTGYVRLEWAPDRTSPDVRGYRIYRSTDPDFVLDATTLLAFTTETYYVDDEVIAGGSTARDGSASKAPATATFYRVTTQDVHGNESAPTITLDSSNPIPVELTTFDATLDGRTARLTWETASETNNAGFAVERRVDDGAFVEMAFIEGAGTTTTPRRYHYDDRTLPFAARQLTYRLRQVDVAGTVTYSPEVMVGIGRPEQFVLHGPFPNPSRGSVTLRYEVPAAGPVHLAIYDLLGRRIRTLVDARQRAGRQQVQFNAAALPSGVYVVRLTSDGATRTQTITVVR